MCLLPEEGLGHSLMGTPDAVGGDTHRLTLGQRRVDLKQMTHVALDRNHVDVGVRKEFLTVAHHLFLLARIHQRVETLLLGHQRVTRNLVVTHMRAQLHKPLGALGQVEEIVVALQFDIEMMSRIHGELIDHHLRKQTVVLKGQPQRAPLRIAESVAEEVVGVLKARLRERGGHGKDIGQHVDHPDVDQSQQPDEPTVHQPVAIRRSFPLLLSHDYSCKQGDKNTRSSGQYLIPLNTEPIDKCLELPELPVSLSPYPFLTTKMECPWPKWS